MQSAEEGHIVMVKLVDGEDVLPGLEAAARKHGIESGAVLWGIGMLQDFEIGFFGPQGYEKTSFPGRHELIAFHSNIPMRSDPKFHLHVALGQPDHSRVLRAGVEQQARLVCPEGDRHRRPPATRMSWASSPPKRKVDRWRSQRGSCRATSSPLVQPAQASARCC